MCNARRAFVAAGVVLLGCVAAISADAQQKPSLTRVVTQPVIKALKVSGNAKISDDELKAAMETVSSACKFVPRYCTVIPLGFLRNKKRLDRAELDRDMLRLRVLYWKRGWRASQVTPVIAKDDNGEVTIEVRVQEGPPTVVGTLDIGALDSLFSSREKRALVSLSPGDPLDLIELDTIAVRIAARLDSRGYGDVTLNPVAVVDTGSPKAAVTLEVNKLYRTVIDSVRVEGTERYDPRLVANTMGVKKGTRYSRERLIESQRALYAAGFFRRAVVRVESGATDSLKRLIASVEELPPRSFRVTGGVSTVDFLQFDARYLNANFRNNAGRLSLQATVGNLLAPQLVGVGPFQNVLKNTQVAGSPQYLEPTFQLNADLRRRWLSDYRNQTGVSVFGFRRSSPGVFIETGGGAAASFTRNVSPYVPVTLQYRMELTNTSAADAYFCVNFGVCDQSSLRVLQSTQRLAPLALTASSDRRDDPIGPTRGYSWRSELEYANAWTGSQFGYARLEVEGAKYFRMTEKLTVAVHGRAGAVTGFGGTASARQVGGRPVILPRKRFYAGGSRSVRGYGENQLGPRFLVVPRSVFQPTQAGFDSLLADPTLRGGRLPCAPTVALPACQTDTLTAPIVNGRRTSNFEDNDFLPKPLGGEAMIETSIEARNHFWGPLTAAVFIDAGSVGAQLRGTATVFTPGIGIRYLSPVGPIRVDLGYNPRSREQLSVITELDPRDASWGATRTDGLFEIRNRRGSNPATGTGFGGIFNQLTLHLSIGEAF
ncbi:MAG: BamA/TamA family outer membrane protein [Gemmatimonadaceae bacterium]|nr:BamA/TamA family outer membrane protein [Gemmatimonadaceae bacterium]